MLAKKEKVLHSSAFNRLENLRDSTGHLSLVHIEYTTIGKRKTFMGLCQQLKCIIEDYFLRYPNMSINSLALRSNVGATTLRRILNDSIKGDPSPHTVLNIASAVTKEKRLSKLVEMFDGAVGEILKDSFSAYIETQANHVYDSDLNDLLRDRTSYFIYKLAANRGGVQEIEVVELFGQLGREKVQRLVLMGALEKDGHTYHARDKDFSLDISVAATHLPEMMSFYKPQELERGLNLFYSLSESLSEEGIKKLKEIQRDAAKKTYEIMNDLSYKGSIPYFTVQVCDTMTFDKSEAYASEGVRQ